MRKMTVSCGNVWPLPKVNLDWLVRADASGALFSEVDGKGGVYWIPREQLPRREQLDIWPEAVPVPVVEWPGSGLVEVGEPVAERVVDDFAGMLPPATWTYSVLQVGEAMDHNGPGGAARYLTFRREASQPNTGWVYAGILPLGVSR